MKKLFILATAVVFGLTACKKEWTCECDAGGVKTSVKSGEKLKKKDAEDWCNAGDVKVGGVTVECELK
jgi:hypothetical protein